MRIRSCSSVYQLLRAALIAMLILNSSPSASGASWNTTQQLAPLTVAAEECRYGNLQIAGTSTVGVKPNSVTTGDFNLDGKTDLAVTNGGEMGRDFSLAVLLGNGDGTFQAAVNYDTDRGPDDVVTADFNSDGKLDLVVANYDSGNYIETSTVSMFLGNGNGTFQSAVNYHVGYGPTSIAIDDFNGDSKLDLAVTNWGNTNAVSVLLGNGDGTFQSASNYSAGNGPYFVAAGDLNGDSKSDLAVANFRYSDVESTVSILIGKGDGTFHLPVNIRVGSMPNAIVIYDFNADSKLDLAVGDFWLDIVTILVGQGDGTFSSLGNYSVSSPSFVETADFDGGGKQDLVAFAGAGVGLLLGKGDATFQSAILFAAGADPVAEAIGHFNGDSMPDLAVVNGSSRQVTILLNGCWSDAFLPLITKE